MSGHEGREIGRLVEGRHFTSNMILWALHIWTFRSATTTLTAMLADRGVMIDHATYSAGCRPMPPSWNNGSGDICVPTRVAAGG